MAAEALTADKGKDPPGIATSVTFPAGSACVVWHGFAVFCGHNIGLTHRCSDTNCVPHFHFLNSSVTESHSTRRFWSRPFQVFSAFDMQRIKISLRFELPAFVFLTFSHHSATNISSRAPHISRRSIVFLRSTNLYSKSSETFETVSRPIVFHV